MNTSRSSGAIIFRTRTDPSGMHRTEILLVRYGQHHWGFPKGRIEPGESEPQAAWRETSEETGIEVDIDTCFRTMTHYTGRSGRRMENVFFVAEPRRDTDEPVPQLSEVSDARWMDVSQAKELITFPGDYDTFLAAFTYWMERQT